MGQQRTGRQAGFYSSVVVETISPAYYASVSGGLAPINYTGKNFDLIPDDAIILLSTRNEEPLMNINNSTAYNYENIVEKTDSIMKSQFNSPHSRTKCYPGAIVSEDRKTIYWVNNTKPLP